ADPAVANREAADGDDRRLAAGLAAGDFVGSENGHDFLHFFAGLEFGLNAIAFRSGGGDDRALDADDDMGLHSQAFDALQHAVDHFLGGEWLHHDDHGDLTSASVIA